MIASIDKRLEANLDGLRIAGAVAWPFVIDQFEEYPEKGELFVVAIRALETADARRLDQALAFARTAVDGTRGLCGAFAWLPPETTAAVVRDWLDATESRQDRSRPRRSQRARRKPRRPPAASDAPRLERRAKGPVGLDAAVAAQVRSRAIERESLSSALMFAAESFSISRDLSM